MQKYEFDPMIRQRLESLPVPLAIYQFIDRNVVTILVSDGFIELLGLGTREAAMYLMDHNMYRDTLPDDVARISDEAIRFATEGGKYEAIYRTHMHGSSEYKILHAQGDHVITEDGSRLAYIWYTDEGSYSEHDEGGSGIENLSRALSSALRMESVIKASYFDYLTGLPSMSYFFELAEIYRKQMIERGRAVAVLFMDFSGMKYYNRKYGFVAGDSLIRAFADILKDQFNSENCSRFGSDHFGVITDAEGIEEKLRKVFKRFKETENIKTLPVHAGIYIDCAGTLDISTGCDRAKYACDMLKNTFYSDFSYFKDSMLKQADERQYIISHLDRAIENGWIQVYYQPIVRAANGMVCDEEALSRWVDPVKGLILPADYIPVLEDAKLIYKLDLYILEQTIEKIMQHEAEGQYVVCESINLSRVDFDTCDIVEEIRQRVDAAGVARDKLSIEITESTLAKDFEYMKLQIERFKELGFNVWMDDFGSGYSSLDVLQSIHFDLIKLDMRFMNEFDSNQKCRIILTELIRMAIALGIDTICEGVETKVQADFLREIGCTKLQGFYFSNPVPRAEIIKREALSYENPAETDYYAAIGRINLYDLTILASEDKGTFDHYFNNLPMAVMETTDDEFKLLRCNVSYRAFMENTFGLITLGVSTKFSEGEGRMGSGFLQAIRECGQSGNKIILDEQMADGSVVHSFIKRIAVNPVTGTRALAVAVLAVMDGSSAAISYTQVAKALSSDYISLYNVDLSTDKFIEYNSDNVQGTLSVERHGEDFFNSSLKDAQWQLYSDDLDAFKEAFSKENIVSAIDEHGAFTLSYRLMINSKPRYVSMKAVRMSTGSDHIIIGVNDIDAQKRQQETLERLKEEHITYSRVTALSGDFICIYTVDPVTDEYNEYSATNPYSGLGIPKEGKDFFADSLEESVRVIHPDDEPEFRRKWSKKNIMDGIAEKGVFTMKYRMILDDKPVRVCLKAAIVPEKGGPRLIVGVTNLERPSIGSDPDREEKEGR